MHSHFAEPTLNIAGGFWRFLEVELQRWVGSPWLMRVSPATVEREKRSHYPPKPPCSSPPENVKCQLGGNAKKAESLQVECTPHLCIYWATQSGLGVINWTLNWFCFQHVVKIIFYQMLARCHRESKGMSWPAETILVRRDHRIRSK